MKIKVSRITDFIPSPLIESIRKYFQENESEKIYIFSPYIKTKYLEKLLEEITNEIIIITTWDTNDLILGSSDIELYNWCKNNGNHLYIHDHIHLKVYSLNLESAIVGSGNVSKNGLMPNGNYEAAVFVELRKEDRIYLEKIKNEAKFVDDDIYQQYLENYEECKKKAIKQEPFPQPEIKSKEEYFLRSALPMTDDMEQVVQGYLKIQSDLPPSEDQITADCVIHDIVNYKISDDLSEQEIRNELKKQFLEHPFTKKIMDEIDNHERKHFGMIKNWIRDHCTEVPLPRPWEFNENTNILMKWLVESGDYREFQYGSHTKSVERINNEAKTQSDNSNKYENVVLKILNEPGYTIEQIKEKYKTLSSQHTIHYGSSDPDENENQSKKIWHYKDEIDTKIAKRFSLSEKEIGERNSRGRLYKQMVGIIINLHENKFIKFWYYKKHRFRSGSNSDGVWRLTEEGKKEIKKRGIINQTIDSQNPISKFNIGEYYHHDDIYKSLNLGFSGGIRTSVKNKLVILFWNAPSKDFQKQGNSNSGRTNIYEDSFENGLYRYIGFGQEGNQKLTHGNKAIVQAKEMGRTIHMFHQHETNGNHEYCGEVVLIGKPETQTNERMNRKEFVFFLKPIENN